MRVGMMLGNIGAVQCGEVVKSVSEIGMTVCMREMLERVMAVQDDGRASLGCCWVADDAIGQRREGCGGAPRKAKPSMWKSASHEVAVAQTRLAAREERRCRRMQADTNHFGGLRADYGDLMGLPRDACEPAGVSSRDGWML